MRRFKLSHFLYRKSGYEQDNLLVMNGRHGLLTMVTFGILQVETSLKTTSEQPLLHTRLNVLFLADEELFLTSTIKRRRAGKRKEKQMGLKT